MNKVLEIHGKIYVVIQENHTELEGRLVTYIDTTSFESDRKILLKDKDDNIITTMYVPNDCLVFISNSINSYSSTGVIRNV